MSGLFSQGVRMVHEEAVELTLQSLRAYWPKHQHIAVAWSGGKDSTATLTLLIHLIDAGELPRPDRLHLRRHRFDHARRCCRSYRNQWAAARLARGRPHS